MCIRERDTHRETEAETERERGGGEEIGRQEKKKKIPEHWT